MLFNVVTGFSLEVSTKWHLWKKTYFISMK